MAVITGLSVGVFTVGGTALVDDLENATLTVENDSEEGAACKDRWSNEVTMKYGWRLESDVFVSGASAILALAASTSPAASVSFTYNTKTYAGTGIVRVGHKLTQGLQRQTVRIVGQGALTHS